MPENEVEYFRQFIELPMPSLANGYSLPGIALARLGAFLWLGGSHSAGCDLMLFSAQSWQKIVRKKIFSAGVTANVTHFRL
jgi:hypothetical protein